LIQSCKIRLKSELEYTSDFEKDQEKLRKSGDIQVLKKSGF